MARRRRWTPARSPSLVQRGAPGALPAGDTPFEKHDVEPTLASVLRCKRAHLGADESCSPPFALQQVVEWISKAWTVALRIATSIETLKRWV